MATYKHFQYDKRQPNSQHVDKNLSRCSLQRDQKTQNLEQDENTKSPSHFQRKKKKT